MKRGDMLAIINKIINYFRGDSNLPETEAHYNYHLYKNDKRAIDLIDCCNKPILQTEKKIYDSHHDWEYLQRCANCGTCWFYRFHEWDNWHGDDDINVWYTMLTDEEALMLLKSEERPDLSFLKNRRSIHEDNDGARITDGQPTYPYR
jgi:hypothetical protein